MPALTQLKLRKGTLADWNSVNPILAAAEPGFESDTGNFKIGDGVTPWKDLGYNRPNANGLHQVADDMPIEVTFDVNKMSAPIGQKITVPTHITPAGGETTHPSVLFFPEGWGSPIKWKYWMAHTPYPGGNDDHEDPNIAVSNDGVNWQVPAGVSNPLADADGQPEYHSDVELKMGPNDTMYLFYRWYANAETGTQEEQFRYFTTKNGVDWTGPTTFHVLNNTDAQYMSPTMVFEDGRWTMWAVDILSSPNRFVRRRTVGPSIQSGWGPVEYPTTDPLPAGKEIWHIYIIKMGGKYFGLLNSCDLNVSGQNGALHFMQSTDGMTWQSSAESVVPVAQIGEHTKLYRSTMVPAYENGRLGFRVWYAAWRQDPTIVWNVYRTFLAPTNPIGATGEIAVYAPVSPSGWTAYGSITVEDAGTQRKYTVDVTLVRNAGTTGPGLTAGAYTAIGAFIPQSIRAVVDTSRATRYFLGVLYKGNPLFNVDVQCFINFFHGTTLWKMISGSATINPGVSMDIACVVLLDKDTLPA